MRINLIALISDCVWECHDHPSRGGLYSLTRTIAGEIQCSCGQTKALDQRQVIPYEYCDLIPAEKAYYKVNCAWDLNELPDKAKGDTTTTTSTTTERTVAEVKF